jgi:hypothetical protein
MLVIVSVGIALPTMTLDFKALSQGEEVVLLGGQRTPIPFQSGGGSLPDCGPCVYDDAIPREQRILYGECPQTHPYRLEYFRCERYNCANGHYYSRIHQDWGACYNYSNNAGCPGSSCRP